MNAPPTPASFTVSDTAALPAHDRPRRRCPEGSLILVVEDDEDTRYVFVESLLHLGYRIVSAASGETGVRTARRLRPNAVLMDVAMPGIDGIEATHRIKADPRTRDCLVIVVTAHGAAMFEAARRAGCDAYFSKPFNAFMLDRVLRLLESPPSSRPPRPRGGVVRRCECRREFTLEAWSSLPLSGRLHVPGSSTVLELRNCPCGTSIVFQA
jgi:CheY-like chemotaxis protein